MPGHLAEPTDFQINWYVGEIGRQASYAIDATTGLAKALDDGNADGVIRSTQEVLSALAAVRRLLLPSENAAWPKRDKAERERLQAFSTARGQRLRSILGFDEATSPLAQGRSRLRNVFEHFDEYVDEYFSKGNTYSIDYVVAGRHGIGSDTFEPMMMRRYDPDRHIASALGTELELAPLILEMRDLREAAARAKQQAWEHDA